MTRIATPIRRAAPFALLAVSSVALATTYLNLDDVILTDPVDVVVDDGFIQTGFTIGGDDSFPLDGTLDGDVDDHGNLELDTSPLSSGGSTVITILGSNRTVNYEFSAVSDLVGQIQPYAGTIEAEVDFQLEFVVLWTGSAVYTCTTPASSVGLDTASGVSYNQSTGLAEIEGSYSMPNVSCSGPNAVTRNAIQTVLNAIIASGPTTVVNLPVAFDPVLTQDEPADCGDHEHGSSWNVVPPANCDPDERSCEAQSCTCYDGDEDCIVVE